MARQLVTAYIVVEAADCEGAENLVARLIDFGNENDFNMTLQAVKWEETLDEDDFNMNMVFGE